MKQKWLDRNEVEFWMGGSVMLYFCCFSKVGQSARMCTFSLFAPLTSEEKEELEKKGADIEKHFSMDYAIEKGVTLRVFQVRKKIDRIQVDQGTLPKKTGEILLEKRYCEENSLSLQDAISVGGHTFQVVGIGSVPDYEAPFANLSDSAVNSSQFGIGFLTKDDYQMLKSEKKSMKSEEYIYAYRLNNGLTEQKLKEKLQDFTMTAENIEDAYFQEYWDRTGGKLEEFKDGLSELTDGAESEKLSNGIAEFSDKTTEFMDENFDTKLSKLTQFLPVEDNMRIGAAADDKFVDKAAGLVAGTVWGYCFNVGSMLKEPYGYFSMPQMDILYEPYLLVYGILLPPVALIFTNYFVIRKKLSQPALALIRNEHKTKAASKAQIKNRSFVQTFQIRQFLREKRTSFTVFFGMFISKYMRFK
ncbi:MAG: hypothetical protein ACI4HI_17355 [Lachnospiraceae bacterium]